jgi:adenine deaminase
MSDIVKLSDKRPPVWYSVQIGHHWDGSLEVIVNDVGDDDRSRKSALDSLQRIGGFQEVADGLHAELLRQIDGLMSAKEGTWQAEQLANLASIVEAYEKVRFQL